MKEVRQIYKITPIYNGSFSVLLGYSSSGQDVRNIPSFVFLLTGDDEEKIIIDTGFATDYIPGINSTYNRKPEEELANALIEHKVYPDEIDTVILTHLHWDHAGGIPLFPNAEFILQTQELYNLLAIDTKEECSYNPAHWLSSLDSFNLIDGDKELRPGLNIFRSGIHSPGHQIVEVTTNSGKIILAGDAPFVYDAFWEAIPDEYWQKFQETSPHFFWDKTVRPIIQAKLEENKKVNLDYPPINLKEVKQKADMFLCTHNPKLKKIKEL